MTIHPNGVATIDGDTAHGVWCKTEGLVHDKWMAEQVCRFIKPGDVVVQGGANIGTLTKPMLDAGATVLAAEPNVEAAECLFHNIGKHPGFHYSPSALSDNDGIVTFHKSENAGASFVTEGGDFSKVALIENFMVWPVCASIRIDTYRSSPSLILLDIEGYEVKALRGAAQTIARCRPVIICEVNRGALERAGSTDAELLGLIEDMGYSISIMQPDCRIADPQFDIVCLPK